jgi:hypothetical protein
MGNGLRALMRTLLALTVMMLHCQPHKDMLLPYMVGIFPQRWRQIIDVMLEKKPGERKIHQLRIVAFQESDFNQSNRLLFGRPLQYALEDAQQLPDIQHGSRA